MNVELASRRMTPIQYRIGRAAQLAPARGQTVTAAILVPMGAKRGAIIGRRDAAYSFPQRSLSADYQPFSRSKPR
jgi:hypothetical protein